MEYQLKTFHKENLSFDLETDGGSIHFNADGGPYPKKVFLGTLAVCSGMDVVAILRKMKVEFSDFSMDTGANLTQEHPKVFTEIHLIYKIQVADADRDKVEKAVKLSQEKYCGISEMLKKNSPLTYEIKFL